MLNDDDSTVSGFKTILRQPQSPLEWSLTGAVVSGVVMILAPDAPFAPGVALAIVGLFLLLRYETSRN